METSLVRSINSYIHVTIFELWQKGFLYTLEKTQWWQLDRCICVFRVSLEYSMSQPMDHCFLGIVNKIVCFSLQCLTCRFMASFTYWSELTTFPATSQPLSPWLSKQKQQCKQQQIENRRRTVQCREVKNTYIIHSRYTMPIKSIQQHFCRVGWSVLLSSWCCFWPG